MDEIIKVKPHYQAILCLQTGTFGGDRPPLVLIVINTFLPSWKNPTYPR